MTINLYGKEYVEVKDRVAAALAEDSYSMLKEETFSMGGREYVRVYIDVKGKQYIGTAECKYNAAPKSPDGMSPFECGETSALGRALGFAGYGVVDSIASADEVVSNQQQERANTAALQPVDPAHIRHRQEVNRRRVEGPQPLTNGNGSPVVVLKVMDVFDRGIAAGRWNKDTFYQEISALLGKPITRQNAHTLTQQELKEIDRATPAGVS